MLRCQDRLLALRDRTSGILQAFLASTRTKDITQSVQVGPAVDKVSVKAVSGGISRRVYPILIIREGFRVEQKFNENGDNRHWVRLGANAFVIVPNCRIRHLKMSDASLLTLGCRLTWLWWSSLSRFSPSQQEGKNTCDLVSEQGSRGRCFVSEEELSFLIHMWDIALWAGSESLYVLYCC